MLILSKRFKKNYKKLDLQSQKLIKKALIQFDTDFSHPSLRMKKMTGYNDLWEISANMDLRITFKWEKPNTFIMRNCGHHDDTLRNP
ncbi:cytotoxin [Bacillus carboniphilus]|uniref:Cytotoxin n=1 Tax=Bacillus carboniphilus TaxID=86663 RepID=A0ABY9JUV6_9BACI|nr:cytotoxin [Bacillus carboniphilus]WLR42210.1 cytotoxin [Bacillus carboniphilus]